MNTPIEGKRRGRRGVTVGAAIVLLLLLLGLLGLPSLLSWAPIRQRVVGMIDRRMPGQLSIADWRLSWRNAQTVTGIRYVDADAAMDAHVPMLTIEAGLLRLLPAHKDLGVILLDSPRIEARLPAAPAAGPAAERPKASPRPRAAGAGDPDRKPKAERDAPARLPDIAAELRVRDGRLDVLSETGAAVTSLALDGQLDIPRLGEAVRLQLAGRDMERAPTEGPSLTVDGSIQAFRDGRFEPGALRAALSLRARALDLRTLQPLRAVGLAVPDVAGRLDGDFDVTVNGLESVKAGGRLDFTQVVWRDARLRGDVPRVEQLAATVDVERRGGAWVVDTLTLRSPIADLTVRGRLAPQKGEPYPAGRLALETVVRLPELAAQFPATLRLRDGVRVTAGVATLRAEATSSATGLAVNVDAALRALAGSRDTDPFALSEDVAFSGRLAIGAEGLRIESLSAGASFADVRGSGSATGAVVHASTDLGALQAEFAAFIDFGERELGGKLVADVRVAALAPDAHAVAASVIIEALSVSGYTPQPLKRNRVDIRVAGNVHRSEGGGVRIDGAAIRLRGLPLRAELACERFARAEAGAPWTLAGGHVTLDGELAACLAWMRELGYLPEPVPLEGAVRLEARAACDGASVAIETLDVASPLVAMTAAGGLSEAATDKVLTLEGRLTPRLDALAQLCGALTGYRPDIAGGAERTFRLRSALADPGWMTVLRRTDAAAAVAAERFAAFGLVAETIELALTVADERATLALDTRINEGRLRAAPYLDLSAAEPALVISNGTTVLDSVKLTDAMASEMLALIHPVFRGCAVMGGNLSLTLDRCRVPLEAQARRRSVVDGELVFREVVLGPDGLLGELMALMRLEEARAVIPDQTIRFETRDERIHPTPLTIRSGPYQLVLTGSVGFDQSLRYWAEVPITRESVGRDLHRLVGDTTARLEIGGTVAQPRISKEAYVKMVADLSKKAALDAVTDEVLRNEKVQEGLRKLEDLFKKR